MPTGFGRDSFCGWVQEPTWGTPVTPPTKFAELVSEAVRTIRTRTPRPVFRGVRVSEGDLYDEKFGGEGDLSFELNYDDQLRILEHLLGAVTTVNEEVAIRWRHEFTLTDALLAGKGLTFYVNRGLDEYQHEGCKIAQVRLTFDPRRNAQIEIGLVAQEVTGVAASTPTFPSNSRYLAGHQLVVEIDDVARAVDSCELTIDNALDTDKRVVGSKSIVEPVRGEGKAEVTGVLTMDALDTDWDGFRAGTLFKLELLHTGPALGAANYAWNVIALKCQTTEDPLRLTGPGIVKAEVAFRVIKPTTGVMLQIDVKNGQAAVA